MKCWLYKGKCLKVPPEGYYGFVYIITNTKTGRIYIGKKAFTYRKKKKLSKKDKKLTGKRVIVQAVDSQWLKYYGSSIELKADVEALGEKYFKREILHLCENKSVMNYLEAKEQFSDKHPVLCMGPGSYNKWIGVKVFKINTLRHE